MVKKLLLIFAVLTLLCSCKRENVIIQFDPMSNFPQTDVVEMDFDMTNGVFKGLELPAEDSVFEFTFTINNKDAKKYYYKILYQNVSYAFDDNHPLSYENFYGSWQDTDIKFKPVKTQTVKDSFKIVGNPRKEKKYFLINIMRLIFRKGLQKSRRTSNGTTALCKKQRITVYL